MADAPDEDAEITAIAAINAALSKIEKPEARGRVLAYFIARFMPDSGPLRTGHARGFVAVGSQPLGTPATLTATASLAGGGELPGIARLTDEGDLKITARDLKAKSGLDAAVRLAHIAIFAYERFTGQPLSSRKGLTPLLREWRLYDGNTRARLAKERGIIRSGDNLSLDTHARRDAEQFVADILNDEVAGQWKPR